MSAGVCNPHDYMAPEVFARVRDYGEGVETPCLIVDSATIAESYDALQRAFKTGKIFYAMKANPAVEICQLLFDRGSSFDIASVHELDRALSLKGMAECIEAAGGIAERISFGNTIKKAKDIRYAYSKGVRLFASDSEGDVRNLAKAAPGAKVYVRIICESSASADWPLSRKFGCHPDMAMDLLILARELGLVPYGISFHVGSQQRDIAAWDSVIAKVKVIFERLREEDGIELKLMNIGGGLPGNYLQRTNTLEVYAAEIQRFIEEDFGELNTPELILEPGRSLVANAGVIISEIVLVSRKSRFAVDRWVYTDVGKFNGLIETLDEMIKYPIWTPRGATAVEEEEVVLAGPTCDSMDILYESHRYKLPLNLCSGDKLYFMSTGAYTASYASIWFNGFPPIQTHIL